MICLQLCQYLITLNNTHATANDIAKGLIGLCRMRTVQAQGAVASTAWEESIKMSAEGQRLGMRLNSSHISNREKDKLGQTILKM